MRRLSTVAPAVAALALASAAPLAGAAKQPRSSQPARPVVLGAGPTAEPSDRPGDGFRRVTFSPDGDGRDDVVAVRVRAPKGTRLRLHVRLASGATLLTVTGSRTAARVSRVTWDGRAPGGRRLPDGSYVLRVCSATTHRCAATRVLVHLRLVTVYTPEAQGVSAGQTVRVHVATDRAGPYTLDLVSASSPTGRGLGAQAVAQPGWLEYRVPDVPAGGLWLLRVRSGSFAARFPLVVHEPALPLDDPPHGTALVVYPYITWRAYNRYDENRDGRIDSWYAHPRDPVVPLFGPFEMGRPEISLAGREAHASGQRAFAGWVQAHHLSPQAVTDVELGRLPLSLLRRYATIVFEGHTEYYEPRTYARLLRYRDGGGRLYFFQGNSFYGAVRIGGGKIVRLSYRYRTAARSDFKLAADGFRSCCWPASIRPVYHLLPGVTEELPWLFEGTGLKAGDAFGVAMGEVDTVDPQLSPRGTIRIASATVPRFTPTLKAVAWLGTRPFPYEPSSVRPRRIDIAYAAAGRGEVFSWGNTGFAETIRSPGAGLPRRERAALDRVALNVWRWFTR
ncbi:MAG: hypothetical protein V7644_502 [Actinomycetota bacterium]